ncbi:hypothetical protein FRB99_005252 [Tulasnella sp. 403]|nr:hypothetical protein FRB99_005252 [Tulasnella sp. 403]
MKDGNGTRTVQHVSFVLLAEFDIDQGSVLSHEYPYPTGVDEQLLAELMIPDGVHDQSEDWTIFFLNQTPGNTIASIFAPGDEEDGDEKKELLHVLNLVRTKHDKTVRRGAIVKALAICTHHPYIQIFKPVLLIALEDYYSNPSVECLAKLFDAVNAMDISLSPTLSRDEKLIARVSERKDVFAEKFVVSKPPVDSRSNLGHSHRKTPSVDSGPQFSIANGTRKLSLSANQSTSGHGHERTPSTSTKPTGRSSSPSLSLNSVSDDQSRRSSMGGSAIWVGEHDLADAPPNSGKTQVQSNFYSSGSDPSIRTGHGPRKTSMDQLSISSSLSQSTQGRKEDSLKTSSDGHRTSLYPLSHHLRGLRDTHFFETSVSYNAHTLPIRVPVTTFPQEVGDYSLVQLIQTFTSPTATINGPAHPHLHTNGALTPPLILLFNALITQKRIIFMGYGRPAGHVANYVLAACALGSGCGCQLRGFIERAFPYTNLSNKCVIESVPGFIAGVTNPIYESLPIWDVLCNIETGKITVHRDISSVPPPISSFPTPPSLPPRSGSASAPADEESRSSVQMTASMIVGGGALVGSGSKNEQSNKADNYDITFVEELTTAVTQHYGEAMIRARVAEYVQRFVRVAASYEESVLGSTTIGFSTQTYSETGVSTTMVGMGIPQGFGGCLGSGIVFPDDLVRAKEMSCNASRIEGWRLTKSYEYWHQDFQAWLEARPIKVMDIQHQIARLRNAKNLPDAEVDLIMRSMYVGVRTYDQIVELLSHLPPHAGGLLPITFGLFHTNHAIRETTVDVINILRSQPIGNQFVNSLNAFHRFAYIQILDTRKREQAAHARQQEQLAVQQHQQAQIAQQLYAAASTIEQAAPSQPLPHRESISQPPNRAGTPHSLTTKSRRDTSSNLVSQLFHQSIGSSSGSSNGHGSSLQQGSTLSRSTSMHRNGGSLGAAAV